MKCKVILKNGTYRVRIKVFLFYVNLVYLKSNGQVSRIAEFSTEEDAWKECEEYAERKKAEKEFRKKIKAKKFDT